MARSSEPAGPALKVVRSVVHPATAMPGQSSPVDDVSMIERLEQAAAGAEIDRTAGLRQLAAVDDGRPFRSHSVGEGRAAIAVVEVLAAAGYGNLELSIAPEGGQLADVPEACRLFGAGCRRISLPARWWLDEIGNFVAMLDPDRSDGRLVAVLRVAGKRYVLVDPDSGDRVAVTAQLAARIGTAAYAIYPIVPTAAGTLTGLVRTLWPSISPDIVPILAAAAGLAILGTLLPIAVGIALDALIPGREVALMLQIGVGLSIVAVVLAVLSLLQRLALLRIGGRSDHALQGGILTRVLQLPASFFRSSSSGDLSARIAGLADIRSATINACMSAGNTVFLTAFYLILMLWLDVGLALLASLLTVIFASATIAVGAATMRHYRREAEEAGWLAGYLFQVLQGIIKLRVAGAEPRAFGRWAVRYADECSANLSARRIANHFGAFSDAYTVLWMTAVFAVAGYGLGGATTAGTFVAFLAAFAAFQAAVLGLCQASLEVARALPELVRFRPILQAEPERSREAADPGRLSGAIAVTSVTFAYAPGASPVLADVSFAVDAGECVAVVGPSGSGKSTLFRLLLGMERPQSGSILFDGQDLATMDLACVRRQIGIVLQHGRVFAGTIMENIRGALNVDIASCLDAAGRAGLAEDLASFPMGLHTAVPEGAPTMSGGQRQRLLIARALVGKPRMLFLDEATSALDNRTQALVAGNIADLAITRLVIAHRLSTVRTADRIIVLDRGRVVETGTYEDLIDAGGLFSRLARHQLV